MAITISDGVTSITIKPYRIIKTNRYAVRPILYPTVVSIGVESKQVEIMFKVTAQNELDFLDALPDSISVTATDHPEVPIGTYVVEACEVRRESKTQSVADCRLSLFMTV